MTTQTIVQALAGFFKTPLNKLPRDKRVIVNAYIKLWPKLSPTKRQARAAEVDKQQATKLRIKFDRLHRKQEQAKKDPKRVAWDVIGWNDGTYSLDARTWWQMLNVTPRNAAMLLCQLNPLRVTDDPNGHSSDETPQGNFGRLLLVFEDVAQADKQAHTLRQWRDIAKSRGLKYHSWIDEYEGAMRYLQKDADTRRDAGRCSMMEAATELTTKSRALHDYLLYLF